MDLLVHPLHLSHHLEVPHLELLLESDPTFTLLFLCFGHFNLDFLAFAESRDFKFKVGLFLEVGFMHRVVRWLLRRFGWLERDLSWLFSDLDAFHI
jgi:hypothetical protein